MSDEETLNPFTVRDALILHDKKLSQLSDLFHQTQTLVQGFAVNVKTLEERINKGISPTMQRIEHQNVDIEKSLIRLEASLNQTAQEIRNSVSIVAGNVTDLEKDRDDMSKFARGIMGKIAVAAICAVVGTFFTMWTMVNRLQSKFENDKVQILMGKGANKGP